MERKILFQLLSAPMAAAVLLLALVWHFASAADVAVMVADINPGADASYPYYFVQLGDKILFRAGDDTHGTELWRSDGTASGTALIKDIYPGGNSNPYQLTFVAGKIFFLANDGIHGTELWLSDGTFTGTQIISDINPGTANNALHNLTAAPTGVFFSADDGSHGLELWFSDGTFTGTRMISDINPGGNSSPGALTVIGDHVYFQASDGVHGWEPWVSDGTLTGTQMISDINPGGNSSRPYGFTAFDGKLFFGADDGSHGVELWVADLPSGGSDILPGSTVLPTDIRLFADLYPGHSSSVPSYFTVMDDALYFAASDDIYGWELWRSAGTLTGTGVVKDINPGSGSSLVYKPMVVSHTLFFRADGGVHGAELWRSDGTLTGTVMVKDIHSSLNPSGPQMFTNISDTLYFVANDDSHGAELWRSDGTADGTMMVADVNPGEGNSYPANLTALNGSVLFSADDGIHGQEVWKLIPLPKQVYLPLVMKASGTPTPPPYPCAPAHLADIPVGWQPRGIAVDEGRGRVYVANYASSTVSVIDSATNAVIETVFSDPNISAPSGITFDAADDTIWVTGQGTLGSMNTSWVVPISAKTFAVGAPIAVGSDPWGITFNPVDGNIYVANHGDDSVSVISPTFGSVIRTVPVGNAPYNLAVHRGTGRVYVANFGGKSVSVLENSGATVSTIPLDFGSDQPFGIAVDDVLHDYVYITTVGSFRIETIDAGHGHSLLPWVEFHRSDGSGVPMRALAFNPAADASDGGHLWTTTSTSDMSHATQILLIPKGYSAGFSTPIPNDYADPTGGGLLSAGVAVNSQLNRVYVSLPAANAVRVFGDRDGGCLVPFRTGDDFSVIRQ